MVTHVATSAIGGYQSVRHLAILQVIHPAEDVPIIDLNGPSNLNLTYEGEFVEESTVPINTSISSIFDPDSTPSAQRQCLLEPASRRSVQ